MTFKHEASIERKVKTDTYYDFEVVGTVRCFLQPMDAESAQAYGSTFLKGSHCYLPIDSTVLTGDRLTILGTKYGVKGVKTHNYGSVAHKHAIIEELS